MERLITAKIFFFLAATLFIAKPFLGFSIFSAGSPTIEIHNILVKSFSKRKPEDLNDAKEKAASIRQQLTNPPVVLFLAITALLGFIFPLAFKRGNSISYSFLNDLKLSFIPAAQPYLLTGKLII